MKRKYERPLPAKVIGSLIFGFIGFATIQYPLIENLTPHMPLYLVLIIAYVASGQVVFLFDYFVARFRVTTGHLDDVDWREFHDSWRKHTGVSFIGAFINAWYLTHWQPSGSEGLSVLIGNAVSALATQTIKWTYTHRPHRKHEVRRKE